MFGLAGREARVVKYDFCFRTLLDKFELRDGIDTQRPAPGSPGLHDALVRHKFDMSTRDVTTKKGERSSRVAADLGWLISEMHGLHDAAKLYDFIELLRVRERLIHPFWTRLNYGFLVDRLRDARNPIVVGRPSPSRADG